jgi:hypothetical protein
VKGVFEVSAKVARCNDATKYVTDKTDPGSDSFGSRRNKGDGYEAVTP